MGILGKVRGVFGGDGGNEVTEKSEPTVEFEEKAVSELDDYQLCYFGTYRYTDETGQEHLVEREFDVYTDEEYRRDGKPVAEVVESHSIVGEGTAEHDGRGEHDLVVDVEPGLEGLDLKSRTKVFLQSWHNENVERL